MIRLLSITEFSVGYARTYKMDSGLGTRINIRAVLEVTENPLVLRKQMEWCDGKVVMDYSYPPDQPATDVGTYIYEETDYAHISWLLPFSFGHTYKLRLDYEDTVTGDTHSAEAETRFFKPDEILVIVLGVGTAIAVPVAYYLLKRRR